MPRLEISRHAIRRFVTRIRRVDPETARQILAAAVLVPHATRDVAPTGDGRRFRRYGGHVSGYAIVVTVDETDPARHVAVSVRPARCGSDGSGRGRRSRAERMVWEREVWSTREG